MAIHGHLGRSTYRTPRALPRVYKEVAQQLGFFAQAELTLARTRAGDIRYLPGVFSAIEATRLFERLLAIAPWSKETMRMYDKMVEVPRLVAWYRDPEPLPAELQMVRERVGALLSVKFNAVSLNYYRDGNDSVAWHSDHDEELTARPVVALLSLGAIREMLLRTKVLPRRQLRCDLEPGSILVMRGDVQEHWEHHIPKVHRPTSARISVALRTKISP
ncbi:MAG: alpha-ketoglutarate-dependent dioxygenase AlkB [Candidatus Meridianibacter frigidus]|nr:MAG: alpha-ketoglutarate-dependent dioxygenase AlkB [Candidatus Eremiobacteraeota bacterium]